MKRQKYPGMPPGRTLRWEVIRLIFGWRLLHTDGFTVYDHW